MLQDAILIYIGTLFPPFVKESADYYVSHLILKECIFIFEP